MDRIGPSIQWYPGHMAKARRTMQENLRHVDLVVELRDARIPYASANPVIEEMVGEKPRLVLLAKEDLAEPQRTQQWLRYFRQVENLPALAVNTNTGEGLAAFAPLVKETMQELLQRRQARGMVGASVRMMVVGVPNVGKSSLINRLSGGRRLQVEDRPGVTLRKQWIKVWDTEDINMELLDMPGVLWPKFEDPMVGEHLAFTGAIKDDVVDIEWLAIRLIERLQTEYPQLLATRYKFTPEETQGLDGFALVELLGRKRGMLVSGGEIDFERASQTLLDEFRRGTLGRITLEMPPKEDNG